MQCYEGLDEAKGYEWKYGKQLLYTQILKDKINYVIGDHDDSGDGIGQATFVRRHFLSDEFWSRGHWLRSLQEPRERCC